MRIEVTTLGLFLACAGCAAGPITQAPPVPHATTAALRERAPAPAEAGPPAAPSVTLAQADRAFDAMLGIPRGDHFDVDRQVAVLREAVLLYTQFLERAQGRPELEPAVRKSRERIADANETIEFLLHARSGDSSR